jgi:hypothetical protein
MACYKAGLPGPSNPKNKLAAGHNFVNGPPKQCILGACNRTHQTCKSCTCHILALHEIFLVIATKPFCAQIQVLDVRAMNVVHNCIEPFHEVNLKIKIQCCKVGRKVGGGKVGGGRIWLMQNCGNYASAFWQFHKILVWWRTSTRRIYGNKLPNILTSKDLLGKNLGQRNTLILSEKDKSDDYQI